MRAVVLSAFGGPGELSVAEVPDPSPPAPGFLVIRATAAGVNPVDVRTREGGHAARSSVPLPMILGWDLSGMVTAVGAGVTALRPGDCVMAMSAQLATGRGTYAELVTLPAEVVAKAPDTIPLSETAGMPLAALTADQALELLALPTGSAVVVTGALGSVGGFTVQLARLRGLKVTALVRSEADTKAALALGAAEVAVGKIPDRAADGLLETAGIADAISGVRDGGRVVSVVPTRTPAGERGITVETSFVQQDGRRLAQMAKLVDQGKLRVRPAARRFGFAEAAEAHRRLAAGGVRGKILLVP
ncbi:NADP-dependent oxidoreductase [Streptomyces sp. NPDC007896]|uniref:NADP-dependent oxidoreductase n=1 Tax=Streptomyces sp. NPDC007896 TaxID=3364784 RepID=UPI0036E18BFE